MLESAVFVFVALNVFELTSARVSEKEEERLRGK
jgi:hypothetical protein